MADKNTISSFTALGTLAAGVGLGAISSALVGSIYLRGDVVTPSAVNTAPSLVYDSGAYLTFSQTKFANTGGLIGDKVATIAVPSSYASGAVLQRVAVECANNPTGGTVDIGIVPASNATGTGTNTIMNNVSAGTGAYKEIVFTGGTLNIDRIIPASHILKATSLRAQNDASQCVLRAWMHERYRP